MKDKIFMILLGIIAVNLTIQTVKDVGIFPTAYAQDSCYNDIIDHDLNMMNTIELAKSEIISNIILWSDTD
jgi:hypothetical protein